MNPRHSTVPIYHFLGAQTRPNRLLGTGFFWTPKGFAQPFLVATNRALLGREVDSFGVPNQADAGPGFHLFKQANIIRFADIDVAVVQLGTPRSDWFHSCKEEFSTLDDLVCLDCSQSTLERAVCLTHKGNAVRKVTKTEADPFANIANGTPLFELSFPALRGAAGSPILLLNDGTLRGLVGILTDNREREAIAAYERDPVAFGVAVRWSVVEAALFNHFAS